MTAYSASLAEAHYTSDVVGPPTITGPRGIVEPGSTSDSPTRTTWSGRSVTENYSGSQVMTRSAIHRRALSEAHSVSDAVLRQRHANRLTIREFVGASNVPDPLLYPNALLYPGSIMDSIVVSHVAPRSMQEILPSVHDTVVRQASMTRTSVEHYSTLDMVRRIHSPQRSLTESSFAFDVVSNGGIYFRQMSEIQGVSDTIIRSHGQFEFLSETVSVSDAVTRIAGFPRFVIESMHFADQIIRRHAAVRRVEIEYLGPLGLDPELNLVPGSLAPETGGASDTLFAFGGHPRVVTERLMAAYNHPSLTLQAPVMGQLWFNTGNNQVIAQLPDWGFVLIESPITGNAMYFQPVSPWAYSPYRTK